MTYLQAYDAARDFISDNILSVWPELTRVQEGKSYEFPSGEFAYFELMEPASIAFETPVTDEVTFTFIVLGVWENDRDSVTPVGREIFKAQKASAMHLALSADSNASNELYNLRVVSIENSDVVDDNAGDRLGVSLVWTCQASIARTV